MEARTLQNSVLRLTTLATALATSLLLLAAASACQSQAEQPASPVATASPTAMPAPTPSQSAPAPEAPVTSSAPIETQPQTSDAALPLKPSLSPTEPASILGIASHIDPPPPSDLVALAKRFRPGQDARLADPPALGPADVGRQEDFWLIDLSRQRVDEVTATLQLVTPHALWYTVGQLHAPRSQLESLAAVFEGLVFPQVAQATLGFVPQQTSGASGSPITMLITPLNGAAGYFASADYYTPGVFPYSNRRPMLYLDARVVQAGSASFASLTGHELQHLLHHLVDPTEHTWVNEGISEVTAGLVARGRAITPPGLREEVSLTNWPGYEAGVGKYYNAAHLFFTYFTQRYGMDALPPLIARPEHGAAGIEAYLRAAGHTTTFDELFMDWTTANLLGGKADMPYGYTDASILSPLSPRRTLATEGALNGSVAPFAADYVQLDVPAKGGELRFEGDATTPILATSPYSGQACWWSNRADSSHSKLTQEFDLSQVSTASLTFRLWHNLEELWDYLYVTASADGGDTWQVLAGTHSVTDDPLGATYGPGVTGLSDGWVEERIDLTPYAGGDVLVAFEQVLDAAISLDGVCIDDMALPEIGFLDDAETDGGWSAEGFVRTNNTLAQRFGVRVVFDRGEGAVTVADIELDAANSGSLRIPALRPGETATVIITSLTPHTRQSANYGLRLSPALT